MTRGSAVTGPVHPQFRCRVCKQFVHGTESGHCPRCGLASPTMEVMPAVPRRSLLVVLVLALALLVLVWHLVTSR